VASIRYEAETQRQHPRYRLPMQAFVEGRAYEVLDWSLGGFALRAGTGFRPGQAVSAELRVPLGGYDLGISTRAEARYVSPEEERAGFAFVDINERQASLLRYVADAVLAGELVEAGEVLDVAGRMGSGRTRNPPPAEAPSFMGRVAGVGRRLTTATAVLAIIGALGAFLWANVYDELYVVRAQTASVSAKTVNLASPAIGRIGFVNTSKEVALGEPILTVNPPVGNPIVIQSPCDCLQVDQRFSNGDFVKTGDTVLQLMRRDAPVIVSALVPPDQLMSLYSVSRATIVYADGSRVDDADILWLPGQGGDENLPRDPSTVVLDPKRSLSSSMVGQPVEVTFDLFTDSTLGRVVHSVLRPSAVAATARPDADAATSGRVRAQ
jgi:mannuronan synthase